MARRSVKHPVLAERGKIERARALRREMTPTERALWQALRAKRVGVRARPQHVILGWIVDFYLPAARLVVEVDGDIHDLTPDDDARRDAVLRGEGLTTLRVRVEQVIDDLPGVLDVITQRVAASVQRAAQPRPSPTSALPLERGKGDR